MIGRGGWSRSGGLAGLVSAVVVVLGGLVVVTSHGSVIPAAAQGQPTRGRGRAVVQPTAYAKIQAAPPAQRTPTAEERAADLVPHRAPTPDPKWSEEATKRNEIYQRRPGETREQAYARAGIVTHCEHTRGTVIKLAGKHVQLPPDVCVDGTVTVDFRPGMPGGGTYLRLKRNDGKVTAVSAQGEVMNDDPAFDALRGALR